MSLHLLKLFLISGAAALIFAVWLYFFINSEKLIGLLLSGVAYFGMLGLFSSGYLLVGFFDEFTPRDLAVITILSIIFIIVIYGIVNALEIIRR